MIPTARADVILCPGQGAQSPGMGRALAEAHPVAREVFARADEILGVPLSQTIWEGSAEAVDRTDVCQPGIYTVGVAALAVARETGALDVGAARWAAGLSLGEYTALHVAGALDFADGLRLVRRRGELMQEASDAAPSGMASVLGLDRDALERCCAEARDLGVIQVANLNAPGQIAISGALGALERASELAKAAGARRVVRLAVAGAFHSELMRPAADRLAEELANIEIRPPHIPVVSNVTARPIDDPAEIRRALAAQVVSPVRWADSIAWLVAAGAASWAEIGPGRVLAGLMRRNAPDTTVLGFDEPADFEKE